MHYRPRLRKELVYAQRVEGGAALYDPIVDRQINLGAVSQRMLPLLDGQRTLDEILAEVAAALPDRTRATLEQTFRSLLMMNAVEGAGADLLDRIRHVRLHLLPYEPLLLDESRFACQGSGECCQNYSFGPLELADAERIASLDIATAFPHLGGGPYTEERDWSHGGNKAMFLRSVDERCVFLLGDLRCGLHAAFGAEAKPGFCRLFPLQHLHTIFGLKIYDKGECASFSTSARSGKLLRDDLDRIRALIPDEPVLFHPIVFLDAHTPCDYGYYLLLQQAQCDLVARDLGDAATTMVAAGRMMRRFVESLARCALAPGEPGRTVAEAVGTEPASLYSANDAAADDDAAASSKVGLAAIAAVAGRLVGMGMPQVSQAETSPHHILTERLMREFTHVALAIQQVALARAGKVSPMGHHFDEAVAVPMGRAEFDPLLRLSLRQQLFGHRMLIDDKTVPAMLRVAFSFLVTVFGAKIHARADGAPAVRPRDFDWGHMLAMRILRQGPAMKVFLEEEALTWEVVEAAPSLLDLV